MRRHTSLATSIVTDILRTSVKDKLILNDWMKEKNTYELHPSPESINIFIKKLNSSKRPLLISGRGAKKCEQALKECSQQDLLLHQNPLNFLIHN